MAEVPAAAGHPGAGKPGTSTRAVAALRRVLLLGGGHAHVEVIRRLAMNPFGDSSVTLVSPDRYTPYSGMLPGFIAGHYRFEDCHIDLEPLCARARIDFRRAEATALDPDARSITCSDGNESSYDLLSIDTGSTPDVRTITGALQHGVRVKPVGELLHAWERIQAELRGGRALSVVVVGGGAGGVELAAAFDYRSRKESWAGRLHLVVLTDTAVLLPAHPVRVQRIFEREFQNRGIEVRRNARVSHIARGRVHCVEGISLDSDYSIVATGASAPDWITRSGLKIDDRGFIAVDGFLRSISHPDVFAVGDIASMIADPRPKMGVYAVRQGPILDENLHRVLRSERLRRYVPQRTALALISTGAKHAVASWNGLAFEGDWVWRWKDKIDRRFMATYRTQSA